MIVRLGRELLHKSHRIVHISSSELSLLGVHHLRDTSGEDGNLVGCNDEVSGLVNRGLRTLNLLHGVLEELLIIGNELSFLRIVLVAEIFEILHG